MSNWFTKRSKGFWWWFIASLFVFGAPQVFKFFVLDGHSLANEWQVLVYPLILVFIFGVVAGFGMSALERKHISKLENEKSE